jgi:hypothetical protein
MGYEPDWAYHEAHADDLASAVLLSIRHAPRGLSTWGNDLDLVRSFRLLDDKRRVVLPAADVVWALRAATDLPNTWVANEALLAAANVASWCGEPDDPRLRGAAAELLEAVASRNMYGRDRLKIMRILQPLQAEVVEEGYLDLSMIRQDDGWSRAVIAQVARQPDPDGAGSLLLKHLNTASGSKPSSKWLDRTTVLLQDQGAADLLRILIENLATAEPRDEDYLHVVSRANTDLARAACWAASRLDADWIVPALRATTLRRAFGGQACVEGYWYSGKISNAIVHTLGTIGSDQAIACLMELQRTVKHSGYRTQINAAVSLAAERAGLSPSELAERVVPDLGLDASGERRVGAALISIGVGRRVVVEWDTPSGRSPRAPADADEEKVRLAKAAAKEVKTALAAERTRLEGLFAEERSWPVADWLRLYLEHPVTGRFTRSLIWSFDGVTGIPVGDGLLRCPEGMRAVPADGTVRLWHPARADTAQVQSWRDYLVSAEIAQPFKQAFREVYLITPAELETRVYSNRFAAHILVYNQLYALIKERGWTSNFLGPHDGGYEGRARRAFPGAGLTVAFDHLAVDMGVTAGLCSTDRVSFYRTADRTRTPVPLAQIPKMVFTEAMRDVDLFVSVTSIALDPHWVDRGEDPHLAYWRQVSFGDLSQTAEIRREALARIVPKLKIAAQLELAGRYLRVRGKLNTYKIHIGSANILIDPDDRYLCIVPAGHRGKVLLPFDGDHVLSLILSKAVLLAADDKITDATITSQLRARR